MALRVTDSANCKVLCEAYRPPALLHFGFQVSIPSVSQVLQDLGLSFDEDEETGQRLRHEVS